MNNTFQTSLFCIIQFHFKMEDVFHTIILINCKNAVFEKYLFKNKLCHWR